MVEATSHHTAVGPLRQVEAGLLNVGHAEAGAGDGCAVVLLYGWPYDMHSYLEGDANGAPHPDPRSYASQFCGTSSHRTIQGGIGHNLPQEAPEAFANAVIDVDPH